MRERSSRPPLIVTTTSEVRDKPLALTPQGEPPEHEMALGLKYLSSLEAAGGVPVVAPPLGDDSALSLLDHCSGLLLSGGPDLTPSIYGGLDDHHAAGPSESQIDSFELALARAAYARSMPILAICRGLQALNVARGGTLHQHLPDIAGTSIGHRQSAPGAIATHWVRIAPHSHVARVVGRRRTKVNSFHHQAVAQLGDGLVATAWASDDTIEAIEAVDREFVIGVQWHAECLSTRLPHSLIFAAFVEAAARFAQTGAPLERVA